MTTTDVRDFEVALENCMEAMANIIDIFGKAAKDLGVE